jgi:transcriptional regulator with PAS, ATPase and Fis domain
MPPQGPGATAKRTELRAAALASFVAQDPLSIRLLEQIKRVAMADSIVLIQGESGTGKDLVASLIHYLGSHPEEPMVTIDCAGLPHELMESELFGFERGAFTGASQMKRGRLELAGRGAVVFDEVAALSLPMQAKLLRVIEDRTFHRLGGTRPAKLEARIMATTSEDLDLQVRQRALREDLFFRLNVVPLRIAPLRERPGDIRALASRLAASIEQRLQRPLRVGEDALRTLEGYDFPGNVRELRNILERAAVSGEKPEITGEDLPRNLRSGNEAKKLSLADIERKYIAEILDYTRGRKSKAAAILGISRKNLLEKRKRYKLD